MPCAALPCTVTAPAPLIVTESATVSLVARAMSVTPGAKTIVSPSLASSSAWRNVPAPALPASVTVIVVAAPADGAPAPRIPALTARAALPAVRAAPAARRPRPFPAARRSARLRGGIGSLIGALLGIRTGSVYHRATGGLRRGGHAGGPTETQRRGTLTIARLTGTRSRR